MLTFAYSCGLAFVSAVFITSGVGHFFKFTAFRTLLHEHGVIPQAWVTLVAFVVTSLELGSGGVALMGLIRNRVNAVDLILFVASAVAGLVFVGYLALLLRRPAGAVSCGCSPLPSPLTPVSLLPATLLTVVSLAGLVATLFGLADQLMAAELLPPLAMWLPVVWGITLAGVVVLLPSSVPDPYLEERQWTR